MFEERCGLDDPSRECERIEGAVGEFTKYMLGEEVEFQPLHGLHIWRCADLGFGAGGRLMKIQRVLVANTKGVVENRRSSRTSASTI